MRRSEGGCECVLTGSVSAVMPGLPHLVSHYLLVRSGPIRGWAENSRLPVVMRQLRSSVLRRKDKSCAAAAAAELVIDLQVRAEHQKRDLGLHLVVFQRC